LSGAALSAGTSAIRPAASGPTGAEWQRQCAQRAERVLERLMPPGELGPTRLHEAMRYAVLGGGKRVRPLLVYAAGELSGASQDALDCAAAAVELIHAYSLVHDDLPCMDNDVLRRGKPTVHVAFGEAVAMLVGDALQALAFEAVAGCAAAGAAPAAVVEMALALARAAGAAGMAGGQAIDLACVARRLDRAGLEDMHRRKTGAMLQAAVTLGTLCGAPPDAARRAALDRYASAVGLAFQVVDDILDVEGDAATLGKTAGKDSAGDKPTYVSILGLDASKRLAAGLLDEALGALAPLGAQARRLRELAELVVARSA